MPRGPAHPGAAAGPGDPVPAADWMTAEEWEAWCDATADLGDEPPDRGWDEEEEPDPASGQRVAWSAGFARDGLADGLPGGSELAFLTDAAAGDDDRYAGATDAELDGAIAAWDRIEAHASARKHLAIAAFIRRRPAEGCEPAEPGGMPARWDEFAVNELRVLLAESKATVERMLDRARTLAQGLPGTMAAYRSGKLRQSKATIIVDATAPLDDDEAKAAEERVLGRAARLTPGGLRDAIAKAVMDVAPDKAKKRREDAEKTATLSPTAAPGPNPEATPSAGNGRRQERRPPRGTAPAPAPGTGTGPGSASLPKRGTGRRAAWGPGGCAPRTRTRPDRRDVPVDHPLGTRLHHRTHPVPHMSIRRTPRL